MYSYSARVLSVYDGDTITLLIDCGFNIFIKEKIRLLGIDTPEIRSRDKKEKEKGLMVKKYVKDLIEGKEVKIETTKKGKFGRYLGKIFYETAFRWKCLNDELILKKYGKVYFGGKR